MIRLTLERKKRGLSIIKLSRIAEIHPSDIGKLESGKAPLWPAWAIRLESVFKIPAEQLMEEVNQDG